MSEGLMKAMRGERRRARELQLKRQGYTPDEIGDRSEREFRSGGITKRDLVDGLRQVMKEERELAAQEQARYADAYNRPEPVDGMKMSRADYEAELARRGLKLSVGRSAGRAGPLHGGAGEKVRPTGGRQPCSAGPAAGRGDEGAGREPGERPQPPGGEGCEAGREVHRSERRLEPGS